MIVAMKKITCGAALLVGTEALNVQVCGRGRGVGRAQPHGSVAKEASQLPPASTASPDRVRRGRTRGPAPQEKKVNIDVLARLYSKQATEQHEDWKESAKESAWDAMKKFLSMKPQREIGDLNALLKQLGENLLLGDGTVEETGVHLLAPPETCAEWAQFERQSVDNLKGAVNNLAEMYEKYGNTDQIENGLRTALERGLFSVKDLEKIIQGVVRKHRAKLRENRASVDVAQVEQECTSLLARLRGCLRSSLSE